MTESAIFNPQVIYLLPNIKIEASLWIDQVRALSLIMDDKIGNLNSQRRTNLKESVNMSL